MCRVKKKCRMEEAGGVCDDMMRNVDDSEWDEDVDLLREDTAMAEEEVNVWGGRERAEMDLWFARFKHGQQRVI